MTEIHIKKGYKSISGFIRAVRHYMSKITGEYPEDVLTGCYNSDEDMESVIRATGTYYYESPQLNIDVQIDSHIYLYVIEG